MADVGYGRNGAADRQIGRQVGEEFIEVVATASTVARHACAILEEGSRFDIEIEVPGWTERVAVHSPSRPGAVRGAVEKMLRDLDVTTR